MDQFSTGNRQSVIVVISLSGCHGRSAILHNLKQQPIATEVVLCIHIIHQPRIRTFCIRHQTPAACWPSSGLSLALLEPFLTRSTESFMDRRLSLVASVGGACALLLWRSRSHESAPETSEVKDDEQSAGSREQRKTRLRGFSVKRRLRWLLLAFIPSSLMLGVTNYITTDIASAPLLWIIPLALTC